MSEEQPRPRPGGDADLRALEGKEKTELERLKLAREVHALSKSSSYNSKQFWMDIAKVLMVAVGTAVIGYVTGAMGKARDAANAQHLAEKEAYLRLWQHCFDEKDQDRK